MLKGIPGSGKPRRKPKKVEIDRLMPSTSVPPVNHEGLAQASRPRIYPEVVFQRIETVLSNGVRTVEERTSSVNLNPSN